MKNKNLLKLSTLVLSTFLLVGCGRSSDGTSSKGDEKTYYTVTFMNGDQVFATKQAEANDVVERPETNPTRDGYEFTGWFTEATEGVKWVFETDIVQRDMSLYAQFEANQVDYTVNFILNGETVASKTTDSKAQEDVVLSAIAVDEGKSLLGWGVDTGSTAKDVDYRVGANLTYDEIVELADANHQVNLYAIVKDGEIVRLNVGVWGRYIEETNFELFYNAFKTYADEKEIVYDFLDYTYFEGKGSSAPYYGVLDYSTACKTDTSITVAFPTGGNFRGNTSAFKDAEELPFHELLGAKVFGESGRYISRWGTDDLSVAFTTWVLTEDALKILDPDYEPPKPYPVEPASESKLVVGVWGRWLTSQQSSDLIDAYKVYASENSISYDEAKVEYYEGADNTEPYFNKAKYLEAIGDNPAIDIMLPVTASIANGTDADLSTYKLADKVTNFVDFGPDGLDLTINSKNDRAMCALNEDDLTNSFVDFIKTEAAMQILDPTHSGGSVDPDEGEETEAQKVLYLTYYAKFISDSETTGYSVLTTAFRNYIAGVPELSSYTVTDEYIGDGLNNANFAKAINKDTDVVLFGASALTSSLTSNGFTVVQTGNIGTQLGSGTERVYHALNSDKITNAFVTWVLSDAGQNVVATLTGNNI